MNSLFNWFKLPANFLTKLITGVIAASAAFIAAMVINTVRLEKIEQNYLEEMRMYKQQADSALQYADSVKIVSDEYDARSDSAVKRARQLERTVVRSRAATDSMKTELDSLRKVISDSVEMARVIIPKQDSIIEQQDVTIETQAKENVALKVALAHKDTALLISNIRGDSLENVIRNIPTPPRPPMVGKLKRTTVFVVGFVTGVVVDALLFRR